MFLVYVYVSSIDYFHVRGKVRGDAFVPHEFDVAICGIVIKNETLSFSLIGHPRR